MLALLLVAAAPPPAVSPVTPDSATTPAAELLHDPTMPPLLADEVTTPPLAAERPERPPESLIFVVPIEGAFENALYLVLVRAMREARAQGASAIVLDMHTPGGRVDAAMKIRDLLIQLEIPSYTFVNSWAISAGAYIAVATDTIVMGPSGIIGGALPIRMGGGEEGPTAAEQKFISVFAADIRATAKNKGHDPDIAEGFANPNTVIPGLKEEGQILTLDYTQALATGFSPFQAATVEELLEREGYESPRIVHFEMTATDRVARWLSSSAVMGILMMIGMVGIFLELKTPGVGLPGLIGGTAIALAFFGSYLANLSGYVEWIFFAIGVALLAIEIYVLPGFGVAGVLGILCIGGSLLFALFNFDPGEGFSFQFSALRLNWLAGSLMTVMVALLGTIPLLMLVARLLPSTGMFRSLLVEPPEFSAPAEEPREDELTVGMTGVAVTDLYPGGVGQFGERRADVLAEAGYLARRTPIVIVRVEGTNLFVRRVAPGEGPARA